MSITLRPFAVENLEENLRAMLALQISDEEMNHAQLGTMDEILDELIEEMADGGRVGLVIYSDETAVGFTDYSPDPEGRSYHIHHFLIDENHRRRGYGETSLRALIAELRDKPDCDQITLRYMSFNDTGAIELYNKVGFVEQMDRPEYESDAYDRIAILNCTKG